MPFCGKYNREKKPNYSYKEQKKETENMIKVTLITNAGRKTILTNEDATPRQIFEENDVNYAVGKPTIDSVPFSMGDMDKSLRDLHVAESCYLTCVVKADNAAEATVMGNACVITSAIKRDDLALIGKYRPDALTLYQGEGAEKEPIFGVALTEESAGSIGKYGATFGPTTNADGNATITLLIDPDETDVKAMLEDKIGAALLKLDKVEAKVPEILDEIKAEQAAVQAKIAVL